MAESYPTGHFAFVPSREFLREADMTETVQQVGLWVKFFENQSLLIALERMAGTTRLELATSAVTAQRFDVID